jgi:hypothetical protein
LTRAQIAGVVALAEAGARCGLHSDRRVELAWLAWRSLAPALRTSLVRAALVVVKYDPRGGGRVELTRDGWLVVVVARALRYTRRGRPVFDRLADLRDDEE